MDSIQQGECNVVLRNCGVEDEVNDNRWQGKCAMAQFQKVSQEVENVNEKVGRWKM